MRKTLFWITIAQTIFCAANLVIYTPLAHFGYVQMRMISYFFLLGFLVCAWLPYLLNLIFKLDFQLPAIISYHVFLVLSIIIGSLWRVYAMWTYYDIIIHFSSGVLIALIAYSLFSRSKNRLSSVWLFFLLFSVALACGGLWEIWEFVTDGIFSNNGQDYAGYFERAALFDTMFDLICDASGAILGSTIAIFLKKKEEKQKKDAQ